MIKKLSDDTFFMYQGDTGTLTGSVIDVAPGIDPDTFTEIDEPEQTDEQQNTKNE